jgi:hypothetical protein
MQSQIDGPPGSPGSGGKRRFVSEYGGGWKLVLNLLGVECVNTSLNNVSEGLWVEAV